MNPRFPASSPRPCGYHTTTIVPLGLAVRKVCPSPLLSRFKRGCIGNRKQKRPTVLEIAITSVTCPLLKSGFPSVSLSLSFYIHVHTYIYMCVRGCACVGACPGPGRRGSNPHCRGRRGSNAGSSVERSSPSPRGKRTRSRSLKDPGQDSLGNLIPCSFHPISCYIIPGVAGQKAYPMPIISSCCVCQFLCLVYLESSHNHHQQRLKPPIIH